jgi:hypothetical protein
VGGGRGHSAAHGGLLPERFGGMVRPEAWGVLKQAVGDKGGVWVNSAQRSNSPVALHANAVPGEAVVKLVQLLADEVVVQASLVAYDCKRHREFRTCAWVSVVRRVCCSAKIEAVRRGCRKYVAQLVRVQQLRVGVGVPQGEDNNKQSGLLTCSRRCNGPAHSFEHVFCLIFRI